MSGDAQGSQKVVRELEVKNAFGFHARPAAMFAKTASQFECEIMIEKDTVLQAGSLSLIHEDAHAKFDDFDGPFFSTV